MCLDLRGGHFSKPNRVIILSEWAGQMCSHLVRQNQMACDKDPDLWWECNSSIQPPIKEAECQRERESMWLSRRSPSDRPDGLQRLSVHVHLWTFSTYEIFFFFFVSELQEPWIWRCVASHLSIFQTWSSLCLAWSEHLGDGDKHGSQTEGQITLACCTWGNCFKLQRVDKKCNRLSYTLICLIDAFQKTLI